MPWWASLYLVVFILSTVAGVSEDLHRPHKIFFVIGEFVAALFVYIFVVAFFDPAVAELFGRALFVMVGLGVLFEVTAARRVIFDNKNDPNFSKDEKAILNNVGVSLGNIFIVPGYLFGVMAGLNHVQI